MVWRDGGVKLRKGVWRIRGERPGIKRAPIGCNTPQAYKEGPFSFFWCVTRHRKWVFDSARRLCGVSFDGLVCAGLAIEAPCESPADPPS